MAVILTCIFAACDKVGEKQVPVYKGMTISRNFAMASATTASDDVGNTDSQGEQGRVEGDYDKRDDDFDQNKPFEDPNAPSIENKANSTLDVVGAAESIYYADKNQDIFITIRLSNPDSYEILSFTLNGKKYSNYMFEDGSDMENLVLKVNVGNVGGIHDYTIDAIKYVDGTDIKDVRMDGNRTVKAGVRANDQTYVNVTNEQKTMTSISFDAQVVDSYSLIEKSGGYAKAVLYDGVNMLTKDVKVGENTSVVFDNLVPNTVYQYGVVALYDNLSGNGAKLNTLYKKAVYTDTIVLFKDVQVDKESIEWGFVWNESFASKQMSAISLWQNDEKVQDVDVTATRLDGLKSNNKYTLKATYKNLQNQDESIQITFTTFTKAAPSVEIANVQSTQTEISFELNVTDTDNVGAIAKIELLHGEDTPIVVGNTDRTFANLLSNNDYTIKVTYTYNLNDGVGEQQIVKNENIKTKSKAIPTVEIANVQSTQTEIAFELNVTDTDNVGAIAKIELLHSEDVPIVVENTDRTLANLLSNNDYTIKVTYAYDLYDGVGEQQIVKNVDIKTKAKATPSVTISNLSSTQNMIECDVAYTDVNGVGFIDSIALFNGDTQVATTSERTHVVFDALEGDTEYTLVVNYKYDLNDGKGEQIATQKEKRYTSPQFEFVEATCANTSAVSKGEIIYFEAKVVNPSGVAIERIKINDRYYTPSSGTTKTSIIVNITVEDQFAGGNTALEVTEIQGTIHGQKVSIVPTQSNVANVFVNGELSVKSIKIVDEDGKECDMVVAGKQYYYIVSFGNKTGYSIDDININIKEHYNTYKYTLANGDYTMQDTQTAKIPVMFETGIKNVSISNVQYSNSSLGEKSKEIAGVAMRAVCVANEVPIVISTADQLKNMNGWGYYVLENDIDLAGAEWKDPASFNGYFDGQGYVIKNMSFVGTVENTSFYWGLFNNAGGIIKKVSLHGRLIVTMNRTNTTQYDARVGGFCATANDLSIESVANNINLSVTNNCDGSILAGGLVGDVVYSGTVMITDSYNTGDVSATANSNSNAYAYAGGLVGYGDSYSTVTITDSYNTGDVSATSTSSAFAGGLVGDVVYSGTVTITGSYNTGKVSANDRAGGLVGYGSTVTITGSYNTGEISANVLAGGLVGYGDTVLITDSYNMGEVSATSTSSAFAGGLVGDVVYSGTVTITDSYNTGNVSAMANSDSNSNSNANAYAGGLVGYGDSYSTVTITDSYNTGDVSATVNSNSNYQFYANAGGLVGYGNSYSMVTITGSYNTGDVSATGNFDYFNAYAGGLVGYGDFSHSTITIMQSYNTGDVSATGNSDYFNAYAGGLVVYGGTVTITDSYNTGDVGANSSAGGLVGYGDTVTITDSYYTLPENSCNIYGEKKSSVAEILAIIKDKWDSTVWDFDNLDENGNPTLKI